MERQVIKIKGDTGEKVVISVDGSVHLLLPNEKRWKLIGFWHFEKEVLYRRRGQYHIFKKAKAIAFPYILLKYLLLGTELESLRIVVEGVGVAELKREGLKELPIRHFKDKGYEKQVFIPLSLFKKEVKE